ncbi:MAG: hypothetical protein HKO64_06105 [Xanthomonadales bacterium]|nr:cytochrome c3 family protein [Gammaproteobacteria bacterium]NNE05155.1 hypothetical protein [Xanthomonadales bacterium]NNL95177.1 hypothetical protein [Xanthomonadales bacterium]
MSGTLLITAMLMVVSMPSWGYPTYDGCEACHGSFPEGAYTSLHDNTPWPGAMMGQHSFWVSSQCNACHKSGPMTEVFLNQSDGIQFPNSCVGCHGRAEDVTGNCTGQAGNLGGAEVNCGAGSGLRQVHELRIGAGTCTSCHTGDAAPVGEDINPANYAQALSTVKNACDSDGTESKFGPDGLDNDGDGQRDASDTDCGASAAFVINAGLNDAWVTDEAPFQGIFLTVFENLKAIFLAWFTFDSMVPVPDTATFGASDQRWVTGLGIYDGDSVTITAELTSGGIFNGSDPMATQNTSYGTITIVFKSCSEAILTYDFPSLGLSGQITLGRVLPDNVALCESMSGG